MDGNGTAVESIRNKITHGDFLWSMSLWRKRLDAGAAEDVMAPNSNFRITGFASMAPDPFQRRRFHSTDSKFAAVSHRIRRKMANFHENSLDFTGNEGLVYRFYFPLFSLIVHIAVWRTETSWLSEISENVNYTYWMAIFRSRS